MKRTFILICIIFLVSFNCSYGITSEIHITVDNEPIMFTDAKPFIDKNNRTQVPLRALAETLDYGVIWDPADRSALLFAVENNGRTAKCFRYKMDSIEVETMEIYGSGFSITDSLEELLSKVWTYGENGTISMDTSPTISGGRTYIPVRYVANLFNKSVQWNAKTSTVMVTDTK